MNKRFLTLGLFTLALGAAFVVAQSGYNFVVNNKNVKLETMEKSGKVFVEVSSFAKALGATVAYDKAKRTYTITAQTSANATNPTQGTQQLAGGFGEIGKSYSIGKNQPLNFTLRSAEFTVVRQTAGDLYAPKYNEKLLVLHFTVQNPNKVDTNAYYGSFKFTAVDDKDRNIEFNSYWAREGETARLDLALKPAQKIDVVAVESIAADVKIPKLIVQRGDDAPVVRYDLSGKVKPLGAPFADPADASGSTALEVVTGQAGTYYPMGALDVKFEGATFSTEKMDNRTPKEGKRFLVATFSVRNGAAARNVNVYYGRFGIELTDADGVSDKFEGYIIRPSRDEKLEQELRPGAETKFRAYFELPSDLGGKTISIYEDGIVGKSRTYSFDVSNTQ